ncbi:MAG: outer membrane protein transport protein, partial [Gammaproteobacteria bacterium]
VALVSAALPALAGGLYAYDANPADAHSARAAWLNPAAMTASEKPALEASAAIVVPVMKFDSDIATVAGDDGGNAGIVGAIPEFSYVRPLGGNWWFGFSAVGLFGGGVDYGDDFVGRYSVSEVELMGVGLVPSIAYRFNDRFSLGAGISLTRSQLDQKIAFRNIGAADGQVHFDNLDDFGVQPFAGMTLRLGPATTLGLVYRAEMDIELEGDVQFSNIAPNVNPRPNFEREAKVDWTNAQTVELGLEQALSERDIVTITGTWEDWSVFDDNVIAVDAVNLANVRPITLRRNWKDTFSVGANYVRLVGQQALSVGVKYVSSPVDDADRTFDLPYDDYVRINLGYQFAPRGAMTYSLGGSIMITGDAAIDQTFHRGTPLQSRVSGEFDTNIVYVVGGAVRYNFD